MAQDKERKIDSSSSLIDALKLMDQINKKLLLVFNGPIFKGLLSVGDIQRAILNGEPLEGKVQDSMRSNFKYGTEDTSFDEIKSVMVQQRMEMFPILNNDGDLVKVHYWEDLFGQEDQIAVEQFSSPVVIMAGGFGTRLRPLTHVLPKPLIPIGEKTMLEEIISRFQIHGVKDYFISVNYKADLIKFYLDSANLGVNFECYTEDKPLGTAGSLFILKGKLKETFFVTNCDILIEDDYHKILSYHQEQKNEITLVSAFKHIPISYGTLETGAGGVLKQIKEKPELTFQINSGMYVLEPHLLEEIPENEFFHITHLIDKVLHRKGKVGVFPVSEKSWKDIGEVNELRKFYAK